MLAGLSIYLPDLPYLLSLPPSLFHPNNPLGTVTRQQFVLDWTISVLIINANSFFGQWTRKKKEKEKNIYIEHRTILPEPSSTIRTISRSRQTTTKRKAEHLRINRSCVCSMLSPCLHFIDSGRECYVLSRIMMLKLESISFLCNSCAQSLFTTFRRISKRFIFA